MLRWLRRGKRVALKADKQITECCDADFVVKCVGREVVLACANCGGHIGHVVDRTAANLSLLFETYLARAVEKIGCELSLEEADKVYALYIKRMESMADGCVLHVLKEYLEEKK